MYAMCSTKTIDCAITFKTMMYFVTISLGNIVKFYILWVQMVAITSTWRRTSLFLRVLLSWPYFPTPMWGIMFLRTIKKHALDTHDRRNTNNVKEMIIEIIVGEITRNLGFETYLARPVPMNLIFFQIPHRENVSLIVRILIPILILSKFRQRLINRNK